MSDLRTLLRRARGAGWHKTAIYRIDAGARQHVWTLTGNEGLSVFLDEIEYTGPTCRITIHGAHDPAALARLGEVLGLLPEDHPDPCVSGPGTADTALSAEGAPVPAAGAPAQDPDAPPYASPYAYRAERGWRLT